MSDLPAPVPAATSPALSGPAGWAARAVIDRPGLAGSGQYLGFFASYLLLWSLGVPLVLKVGFAFMIAMSCHVWVQSLPTRLSRGGDQSAAARLASTMADQATGELAAVHRLDAAEFWLRAGDVSRAKETLAKVFVDHLPREGRLRYFQVSTSLWIQVGDPDGALVMSDAALAADGASEPRPELLLHRALALFGADRRDEALATLEQAEAMSLTGPQKEFAQAVRAAVADA
jgi:outer membrane PBP1 activator LpoA protein